MIDTARNSKASPAPKGRPTARRGSDVGDSRWSDPWITIQRALLALAAVAAVVVAFYLTDDHERAPSGFDRSTKEDR